MHCWNQPVFGNKHTTAKKMKTMKKKKYLKITQTTANRKFSRQNKHSTLQTMNHCHSFCDKNRYPTSKDIWLN